MACHGRGPETILLLNAVYRGLFKSAWHATVRARRKNKKTKKHYLLPDTVGNIPFPLAQSKSCLRRIPVSGSSKELSPPKLQSRGYQKAITKLSRSYLKAIKKLSRSYQKAITKLSKTIKKLSKSYHNAITKLSKSYQEARAAEENFQTFLNTAQHPS